MNIVSLLEILFSYAEMAEFGQLRLKGEIAAGATTKFTVSVPYNQPMFIYRYKFGDIPINVFNFRWESARNEREQTILLGTEHTNFDTRPFPFLIAKGTSTKVVVENTDNVARTFEMTIDYFTISETYLPKLEEMLGWKFQV
ncbi:MAG: hypothetical protein ACTSUF_03620 [Candidatus Heimdallarchaeaceae archaeon]